MLFAVCGAIEQDLRRFEKLGIFELFHYSNWVALVPVPMPHDHQAMWGYKMTMNPILKVDHAVSSGAYIRGFICKISWRANLL